jgi:hypothetical protein
VKRSASNFSIEFSSLYQQPKKIPDFCVGRSVGRFIGHAYHQERKPPSIARMDTQERRVRAVKQLIDGRSAAQCASLAFSLEVAGFCSAFNVHSDFSQRAIR